VGPFDRRVRLAPLYLAVAIGCGARTDLPCRPDEKGPLEYTCNPCRDSVDAAPSCEGTGKIWSSLDDCIDDGGTTDSGDLLEVYCVDGLARFCLSHEACPWRDGAATARDVSCSTSGLESTFMASAINGCHLWEDHDRLCCSEEGKIGFP
jgi:hypothetical protein